MHEIVVLGAGYAGLATVTSLAGRLRMELLAPDVALWTDGGGKVRHAMRPVRGADRVAAWLAGVGSRPYEGVEPAEMSVRVTELNGAPGLVFSGAGRVLATMILDLDERGASSRCTTWPTRRSCARSRPGAPTGSPAREIIPSCPQCPVVPSWPRSAWRPSRRHGALDDSEAPGGVQLELTTALRDNMFNPNTRAGRKTTMTDLFWHFADGTREALAS